VVIVLIFIRHKTKLSDETRSGVETYHSCSSLTLRLVVLLITIIQF